MAGLSEIFNLLESEKARESFGLLYGSNPGTVATQIERYQTSAEKFTSIFPKGGDIGFFSTSGRTEICGNHTDHNAGRVLAAAVDLDVIAAASPNSSGIINIKSEGYPQDTVDIRDLDPMEKEIFSSTAIVRGICARFAALGYSVGGFDAYTTSNVLKGSGLSSSAAFEVLVATIINHFYNNGKIDPLTIARISQYSENVYFGKPCGLMDQTTCSAGGFVTIDFKDREDPVVKKVDFDFQSTGHTLVIIDTGGNHADLNEDYASVAQDMKEVARALGGKVLREFNAKTVIREIGRLRSRVSDRAILRALHFYADDLRVAEQVEALESQDFGKFLELVKESGRSSWMMCQNCFSCKNPEEQGVTLALAISENILGGRGAWRVHGGGFAGTIQAFVPNDLLDRYILEMSRIFGGNSCHKLIIRPFGSMKLTLD